MYIGPDPQNPNLYLYQTSSGVIKSALPPHEFRGGEGGVIDERQMTALPASELPPVPASVGGAPQWIQRGVADPQAAGVLLPSGLTPDELSAMEHQVTASAGGAPQAQGVQDWSAQHAQQLDPQGMEFQGQLAGIGQVVRGEQPPGTLETTTPTDRPPAPETEEPPPTVTPSARMASIRGELAEIAKLRKKAVKGQRESLDALTTDYQTELNRIKDESEITDARGRVDKARGALGTITNKLASFEINPQRAFPNAFSKVAAVISVAMGAYAQGLSGGKLPNTALQIINTAIDRDIDAQKMEYQKLKGLVDEKRNVYAMAMRELGDETQATALLRTAAHQAFGTRFKTLSQQMGIENSKISQAYQEAGLLQRENAARANLDVLAAKSAQSALEKPKFSEADDKDLADFQSSAMSLKDLWAGSKDINAFASMFAKRVPWETDAKTFDRVSIQSILAAVKALSGVAYREEEFKRIGGLFPSSTDIESTRKAKIVAAVEWAANRGMGRYNLWDDRQKAWVDKGLPALGAIYKTRDPAKRRQVIMTGLFGEVDKDVFAEVDQYKIRN